MEMIVSYGMLVFIVWVFTMIKLADTWVYLVDVLDRYIKKRLE